MKERLTGAIILVALIVLLVPELLTGPVRSTSTVQPGAAGSSGEPPLRSYTIDLADESRAHGAAAGVSPASGSGADGSAQPQEATEPTGVEAKPPSISEAPQPDVAEAPAVQPGEEAKATEPEAPKAPTRETAKATPPPVVTERPTPAPRPVPKPAPPAEKPTAPVHAGNSEPAHSGGTGGWLVQLGVFASRANADRLAEELKGKGFRVSVSELPSKGKTLYRVHSGSIGDRAAAQELAAKLRAAGAAAAVVPRA